MFSNVAVTRESVGAVTIFSAKSNSSIPLGLAAGGGSLVGDGST